MFGTTCYLRNLEFVCTLCGGNGTCPSAARRRYTPGLITTPGPIAFEKKNPTKCKTVREARESHL
jgi:hypothetical protein